MTDMRERVARALYDKFTLNWLIDRQGDEASGTTPKSPPNFDQAESGTTWGDSKLYAYAYADAALLACGYAEMRQALEELHTASARVSRLGATVGPQWSYLTAAVLSARSILERTGDKP